jgi:hypothetical protein
MEPLKDDTLRPTGTLVILFRPFTINEVNHDGTMTDHSPPGIPAIAICSQLVTDACCQILRSFSFAHDTCVAFKCAGGWLVPRAIAIAVAINYLLSTVQ